MSVFAPRVANSNSLVAPGSGALLAVAAAVAAIAATGAALAGPVLIVALLILGVVILCAVRPVAATYLYIATLPFVAGIPRGAIPLRPNEMLLGLVLVGVLAGLYVRYARGDRLNIRIYAPIDVPLGAFIVLSTLWPLTWLLLRGIEPAGSDLLAVMPVVKLTVLLLLVRLTVVHHDQLMVLVRLIIWTATAIAVIAIGQTLGLQPVVALVAQVDPSGPSLTTVTERGTTTLASSIATGDYIIIGLALLIAVAARGLLGRKELIVPALFLGAGVLAAGQFSTWIAFLVASVLALSMAQYLRRYLVRALPVLVLALVVGAPAFFGRLSGFWDGYGVPRSWLGRQDNLETFYIPPLFQEGGFLAGVSPNSVLVAPETWRENIFLESGYLQFLWVGGIPLLVGFIWLSVAVIRRCRWLVPRADAVGASAFALLLAWSMILVLSIIDPHLFLRGTGDLLFVLLGVVTGGLAMKRAP